MSVIDFPAKERLRFRKLLEVAYSTTFVGEREAALRAAERIAQAHGISLREAAGMREEPAAAAPPRPAATRPHRAGFPADFGAAGPEAMGRWWAGRARPSAEHGTTARTEAERVAEEKRRREEALEDAHKRGLDAEERAAEARKARARATRAARPETRRSRSAWRSRPEFVRVLLAETSMSAKEIAAVAGVTIYDVFKEKLLMRRQQAA